MLKANPRHGAGQRGTPLTRTLSGDESIVWVCWWHETCKCCKLKGRSEDIIRVFICLTKKLALFLKHFLIYIHMCLFFQHQSFSTSFQSVLRLWTLSLVRLQGGSYQPLSDLSPPWPFSNVINIPNQWRKPGGSDQRCEHDLPVWLQTATDSLFTTNSHLFHLTGWTPAEMEEGRPVQTWKFSELEHSFSVVVWNLGKGSISFLRFFLSGIKLFLP